MFYWAYAIGLAVVVAITTAKTLGGFSDLQLMHRVMRPFYNDHTAYGAALAFIPAGTARPRAPAGATLAFALECFFAIL